MRISKLIFILIIFSCISSCALFQPGRIGVGSAKKISSRIDELTSESKIKDMTRAAMEGALSGSASPSADTSLQVLSERLAENIEDKLNEVFRNLDTRTPGKKFSRGVVDNLINKEVEHELKAFLTATSQHAESDLSAAIEGLEHSLTMSLDRVFRDLDKQLHGIDKSVEQVFSASLRDSMTAFVNVAVANLDLRPLSHKLSTELLSKELRDSIISLAADVQSNINLAEPIPDILRVVRQNAYYFAIFSFAIIAFLIYWSYSLRKRGILGEDLTEVIQSLNASEDEVLKARLENFLRDKGHYDFYKKEVTKMKKKK